MDGMTFAPHWNTAPSSSGYPSNRAVEGPHYQPDASGTLHDPFLHQSAAGPFYTAPENFVHPAAPSNYDRQAFHGVEGGFIDLNMGNGRGPHKRKSPGVPSVCERGSSSSRYYGAGSSSEVPLPYEQQEKPNMDSQYMPWDHVAMTPNYRSSNLSIRGEGSTRNVRSRQAHDMESNLARTYLSSSGSHTSYPAPHLDHANSVDLSVQTSSTLARDWGHSRVAPAHGRIQLPGSSCSFIYLLIWILDLYICCLIIYNFGILQIQPVLVMSEITFLLEAVVQTTIWRTVHFLRNSCWVEILLFLLVFIIPQYNQ